MNEEQYLDRIYAGVYFDDLPQPLYFRDDVIEIIKKIKEAYTDGFNDSKYDFDIENYID